MLGLLAVVVAAGCGDADSSESPSAVAAVTVTDGDKPDVEVDTDVPPPKQLIVKDLKVGTGKKAGSGDELTVKYVAVRWHNGEKFQTSWDGGNLDPFTFVLHKSRQVMPGWEKGLPGMKVGGRRELIIPPKYVYWPNTFPEGAAPRETLVYVVDLLKIE